MVDCLHIDKLCFSSFISLKKLNLSAPCSSQVANENYKVKNSFTICRLINFYSLKDFVVLSWTLCSKLSLLWWDLWHIFILLLSTMRLFHFMYPQFGVLFYYYLRKLSLFIPYVSPFPPIFLSWNCVVNLEILDLYTVLFFFLFSGIYYFKM